MMNRLTRSLIEQRNDAHIQTTPGKPKIWNYTEASEPIPQRREKPAYDMRDDIAKAVQVIITVLLGITLLVLIEIKNDKQLVADPPWEEVACAFALGYAVSRWHTPPPR